MPETAWLCWKCVCHAFNGPSYWMWMSNRDQWTANLLLENKVNSSGSPEFSGISSFDRRSRITKRKDISYGIAIKIIMLICIQVRQKGPETSKAYSPLSLVPLLQMTHPKVSYGFCPHPHLKKLPHCLFPNHNRFFFFFFVWAWGIRKFLGWGSNPSHSSKLLQRQCWTLNPLCHKKTPLCVPYGLFYVVADKAILFFLMTAWNFIILLLTSI